MPSWRFEGRAWQRMDLDLGLEAPDQALLAIT
jgi:hypothetical protein